MTVRFERHLDRVTVVPLIDDPHVERQLGDTEQLLPATGSYALGTGTVVPQPNRGVANTVKGEVHA
jgi:hypothetical protein